MAIIALTNTATKVIESKYDPSKGAEGSTKFKIKAISSRIIGALRDRSSRYTFSSDGVGGEDDKVTDTQVEFDNNRFNTEVVRLGLDSVENFLDEKGNEVTPKKSKRNVGGKNVEVLSDDFLDMLSLELIAELAQEILAFNTLKEEDKKKSDKSSSQEDS